MADRARAFRWPWVSRAVVDVLVDVLAHERQMAASQRLRYDELLAQYQKVAHPEPKVAQALERRAPDVVTQAMLAKAGANPMLRAHYTQYIAQQRAYGIDDEQIAAEILRGTDDDGGIPA